MKKIVIFASGSGTNAENIILHFKNSIDTQVVAVYCNNPHAKVIERVIPYNIPSYLFTKNELNSGIVLQKLNDIQPDLIVLAGFLLQFPEDIIIKYPNKIINIHPALLPKYGGKGMYGMRVHEAVLENKEHNTGITVHYVNKNYDEGAIIAQYSINIEDCKSPEMIAKKVHELEYIYFPIVISEILSNFENNFKKSDSK